MLVAIRSTPFPKAPEERHVVSLLRSYRSFGRPLCYQYFAPDGAKTVPQSQKQNSVISNPDMLDFLSGEN